MDSDLTNKTAIVTGASSGIGAAAARELAGRGASVALAARDLEKLSALARDITSLGGRSLALRTDVSDRGSVRAMVRETVEKFGGVDVLVNNAGMGLSGRVAELRAEDLRRVFEVNVLGVLNCTQAALPEMGEGGRIINVSSVISKRAIPMVGGYCASKSALDALTEALRVEVASRGVSVTSVYPGTTSTAFKESSLRTGSERRGWRPSGVPPEKVAEVIARAATASTAPRDLYVSLQDRLFVAFVSTLPGLADTVLGRWAK